uniref:Ionotropic receptor 75a-like n=1 Tax=Diabrotica virgifera virgifera TaxID=50390 RepID=A0A6P7G9H1_DIAVI
MEHQLFMLDTNCPASEKVLDMGNQLQLFNQPYRWIIWGRTDRTIFKNIYFRVDSQIYLIEHTKRFCKNDTSDPVYKIKSLYKLSDDHLDVFEDKLVEWTPQKGFLKYSTVNFFRQRKNLNQFNLNVSYVITNPDSYNHLEDFRNIHIDAISKLNWIIVGLLLSTLNASSTNIFQPTWGYREGNSTIYSGMIGDLQTNRAEIGGTASFFTLDRLDVIEYVAPSAPTFMKFIFKAPPLSYVSNVFTLPFDTYVWYCCFALVPIIFIAGTIY